MGLQDNFSRGTTPKGFVLIKYDYNPDEIDERFCSGCRRWLSKEQDFWKDNYREALKGSGAGRYICKKCETAQRRNRRHAKKEALSADKEKTLQT